LYYVLWQWGAYRLAARLHAQRSFAAVHHITFGVTRHPSFMGGLGVPFVLGPLGGGETAPARLRRHFSLSGYLHDAARDMANLLARWDPSVRAMYSSADLILLKTPQSLRWLPRRFHDKAACMLEIGVDGRGGSDLRGVVEGDKGLHGGELRLLYVGRFLYLKGIGLGLRAVALLRSRGVLASLTLIGQGPEEQRWRALAGRLGLAGSVHWIPWMRQPDLLAAYRAYDAMLFPSLRDSSGNVVLEAMSGGLPVVCLGLGGPAEMVDAGCGRVVDVDGRDEAEVIASMADALEELARNPSLLARLRTGALAKSAQYEWRQVVGRIWGANGLGCRAVTAQAGLQAADAMREGAT
jgi:glycosyltransferase involved in cell wall biosynthesis